MEITFNIKEACRCFEKDAVYRFVTDKAGILYICGKNGSGKSTLLHVMRSAKDSLKDVNRMIHDGLSDIRLEHASREPIELSGFDYDEVFYLDSVTDDPLSIYNSGTASSFVDGGGMVSQKTSRGQNSLTMLGDMRIKATDYLTKKYGSVEAWKESGKTGLVVLDEVDDGFDMQIQFKFNDIVEKVFIDGLGCDVICVSHNPVCLLSECECPVAVHDIVSGDKMLPNEYIMMTTRKVLKITDMLEFWKFPT